MAQQSKMISAHSRISAARRLPSKLRRFFWDCRFASIHWPGHQDFVIARILVEGDWPAIQWLRKRLGDQELRQWIIAERGRRLSPRQLRFWELLLDLPGREVDCWLADPERAVWDQRSRA